MRAAALLLALGLATASPARAQPFDGTQPVDAFTGPLVASSRIVGLGGAYVAVAEGLGGAVVNPAAVAQRNPRLASRWDWDWLLTWYVPDTGQVGRQDLGNDGGADVGLSGAGNGQVGLSLQRGRLGVAVFGGGWNLAAPRAGVGSVEMEIAEGSLAVAGSFRRDALLVGGSVTAVSGVMRVVPRTATQPAGEVEYSATALRLGVLFRPRGTPWRLGAALRAEAHAKAIGDRTALPIATPSEFVFPWTVSMGAARWIGPNADRANEPPAYELERHPEWGPGPKWEDGRARPVLVALQLDVVGPTPGAVAFESALVASAEALPSGASASLVPRAGAEWEAFADRLRIRGGAYLEPSRTGAAPRPHATFGLEGRIPFPWRALQLGLAGDVAERFQNVSLSLGFWSSLGPSAPRPAAAAPDPS